MEDASSNPPDRLRGIPWTFQEEGATGDGQFRIDEARSMGVEAALKSDFSPLSYFCLRHSSMVYRTRRQLRQFSEAMQTQVDFVGRVASYEFSESVTAQFARRLASAGGEEAGIACAVQFGLNTFTSTTAIRKDVDLLIVEPVRFDRIKLDFFD